jgi:Domain of unknown function (DUF1841)
VTSSLRPRARRLGPELVRRIDGRPQWSRRQCSEPSPSRLARPSSKRPVAKHLDPTDDDHRAELIRLAHPELAAAIDAGEEIVVIGGETVNPRLHLLMHHVVAERLLHDEPPEDWLAFQAVLDHGVDAHDAQHAIGRRLVEELIGQLGPPPGHEPAPARARVRGDTRARQRRKVQRAARRRNRR